MRLALVWLGTGLAVVWGARPVWADVHTYPYVAPGHTFSVEVRTAPLPGEYAATQAWTLHEQVRTGGPAPAPGLPAPDEPTGPGDEPPDDDEAGDHPAAPAPTGTPTVADDLWRVPWSEPRPLGSMPTPIALTPPAQTRIAFARVRGEFTVGPELGRVRVLRLRARYQDALRVQINGVTLVRRNLVDGEPAEAFARRPHGPEWETFYLPVDGHLLRRGANTVTFELWPAPFRLAPSLDVELTGGERPALDRGPIVQRVTGDSAVIVFETDLATAAEIHYGAAPDALDRMAAARAGHPILRHVVALGPLTPGQRVFYKVVTPFFESPTYAFFPAPGTEEVLRFAVFGDVRSGHTVHAQIVAALVAEAPDFVLTTGDQVMRGSDEADWQKFFAIAGALLANVPYYPVLGNHDLGQAGERQRRFEDVFALWPGPDGRPLGAGWYSFDVAGVHFVMLDSNRYSDPQQVAWLAKDLGAARARHVRAIFAATHAGPFSRGPHGGHPVAQALYVPVLEQYGVTVLFSGHDHMYQRGKVGRLSYVVSGGGGAPLYAVRCGGPRQSRCKTPDGAALATAEHHYLVVEVFKTHARLCPKRPDQTPLERCFELPLR